MTLIGNVIKATIALAMIVSVLAAAYLIFISANFNFTFGSSSSDSGSESSDQTVMFKIQPGEDVATVAANLEKQGIIDSPLLFTWQVKLNGADKELKAGEFQLTPGMDTGKLIETLTTSPAELGVRFTVIEGTRIGEIADKLSTEGIVDKDNFLRLAGTAEGAATFSNNFLATSGKPADQGLEGYLFPDTYEIKKNSGDNSEVVIRTMLQTMEAKFTPEMQQRMAERNISTHTVLTIASIVQREGRVKEELPTIAAVYWNRVGIGMKLDADPTVQYAVGTPEDWWPVLVRSDERDDLQVDSPYNTYRTADLPPGPIASPGFDAINATVFPEQNDYLYFVAKGDGSGAHVFARTLEEQERNRVQEGNR